MRIVPGEKPSGTKWTVEVHKNCRMAQGAEEVLMLSCEDKNSNSYDGNERIFKDGHWYVVILKDEIKFAIREDGPFEDNGWTDVYAFLNSINNNELNMYEIEGGYNVLTGEGR